MRTFLGTILMPARAAGPTRWKKLIAAISLVFCCAHLAVAQSSAEHFDENGLLIPGEPKTDRTTPASPFEYLVMTLLELEEWSRNSLASQEVNRNLNSEFANYREPVAAVAFVAAILASALLAVKAAWLGIPLVSAIATVIQRGFFRWPTTPLEWVNKLAIYIGLADFVWWMAT